MFQQRKKAINDLGSAWGWIFNSPKPFRVVSTKASGLLSLLEDDGLSATFCRSLFSCVSSALSASSFFSCVFLICFCLVL
jgi:hypothetical protein